MQRLPHSPGLSPEPDPRKRFVELLAGCIEARSFVSLSLDGYSGSEPGLKRMAVRPAVIRDRECLTFVYGYQKRDVTRNLPVTEGLRELDATLMADFRRSHLVSTPQDALLTLDPRGAPVLRCRETPAGAAPSAKHDREKRRYLDLNRPFLAELGVVNAQHQLIPAMSRKWKQINKFLEILDHAWTSRGAQPTGPVSVVDFGCGKGYLTFAVEDYLRNTLRLVPHVTGVELREDLVQQCRAVAARLQLTGLNFSQGDVLTHAPSAIDIMIALHACDTATDHAIHLGVRAGAAIILCSPCCHKQLRPQMQSPATLRPVLRHGIHMAQEAEMVTDALRALLLEASGYDTQVFEFVSLEHTSKNKMILGVKRAGADRREEFLTQVRDLKAFYGIREHCLETLLQAR